MALIKIGGTALPAPSSYAVSRADLDGPNTKRTEDGKLQRDRVRAGVYKIELSWDLLTPAQLQTITNAIAPVKLTVVFFDPTTFNTAKTASMYAGDRSSELVRNLNEDRASESYWSLSFNLTEF